MKYKYAHDLPRRLNTDGMLVPKHEGIVEGWYLLHGDVPDICKIRDAMRQLVDAHYFSESLHFQFIEKNITKTTALDVVDAVRQRKGLMDHVDLSVTYLCELRTKSTYRIYVN